MMPAPSNYDDQVGPAANSAPWSHRRLAAVQGRAPATMFTVIFTFQFLTLLLPRDGGSAAIIYATPLITTLALVLTRQFQLRLSSLLALSALLLPSLLFVSFGQGGQLNLVLSLATYSSLYLLVLAPAATADERRLQVWERLVVLMAVAVVALGLAQLVARGFPLRLPYFDFSPDVFEGPYGAGGHRLVPLVVAPALFLQVLRVTTGAAGFARTLPVLLLLVFGTVAPGANAMILAIGTAVGAQVLTVMARRAAKTLDLGGYFLSKSGLTQAVVVGGLAIVLSAGVFAVTGTGSLPHVRKSISSLLGVNQTSGPRNAKVAATLDTLLELPAREPLQPAFGVGLGNYSSWSQLLLSGVYVDRFLSGRVGGLPVSYDDTAWDLILWHISPEAYDLYGRWYVESISTQPWSSWQSLYAETGLLGLILLIAAFAPLLKRLTVFPTDSARLLAAKYALGTYAWFAVVCGFIDNFFEYPWLLIPLILGLLVIPRPATSESAADPAPT